MKTLKVEAVHPMAYETFDVAQDLPRFIDEVQALSNAVATPPQALTQDARRGQACRPELVA